MRVELCRYVASITIISLFSCFRSDLNHYQTMIVKYFFGETDHKITFFKNSPRYPCSLCSQGSTYESFAP